MSHEQQLSVSDAIRQSIMENDVSDYADVIEIVRKKYGLAVSSADVERVYGQMMRESEAAKSPEITLELGSFSGMDTQRSSKELPSTEGCTADHLGHAMQFVKSVGGFTNAKKALSELETTMKDITN